MTTILMALSLSLAGAAAPAGPDTLVRVEPGTRVAIHGHGGTIVVRGWERDAVELLARDDGATDRVRISRSARGLSIHVAGRRGGPAGGDLTVRVPAASPLEVHASFADVEVEGAGSAVAVRTVDGDIRLEGGADVVSLHTVAGDIEVRGASGRLEVNSMDGDIRLVGVRGEVLVNTVDGDVHLEGLASESVRANTVDGDVLFRGELRPGGFYRLSTHDGDLTVVVPASAGATVSATTWQGELETSFPIDRERRAGGRRFELTIGDGGARIELQSFQGRIRLVRPGETASRDGRR